MLHLPDCTKRVFRIHMNPVFHKRDFPFPIKYLPHEQVLYLRFNFLWWFSPLKSWIRVSSACKSGKHNCLLTLFCFYFSTIIFSMSRLKGSKSIISIRTLHTIQSATAKWIPHTIVTQFYFAKTQKIYAEFEWNQQMFVLALFPTKHVCQPLHSKA